MPTGTSMTLVWISGALEPGDAHRFKAAAADVGLVSVLLNSPGGHLLESLEIGRTISERGYLTGVPPNTVCASACALVWLAGADRYMSSSSRIGFHAAYAAGADGRAAESGMGNALVGAYLNDLGLAEEAIVFATLAGPDEMAWLTVPDALRTGIRIRLLNTGQGVLDVPGTPGPIRRQGFGADLPPGQADLPPGGADLAPGGADLYSGGTPGWQPRVGGVVLALPSGRRWIVLESATRIEDLDLAASAHHVVTTRSGHVASVLGPFDETVARDMLGRSGLPGDAYLSSGTGFLTVVR